MIALGNDVVDLTLAPKNGQAYFTRLGSYAFSASERHLLLPNISANEGLMLLWSIKEACYKSAMKLGLNDRFNPINFSILDMEMNSGFIYSKVKHSDNWFISRSTIEQKKIHSITVHEDYFFDQVSFNDELIASDNYTDQHLAVRNLLKRDMQGNFGAVSFSKNEAGIPFVMTDGEPLLGEISFSHHGKVIGYALTK